MRCNALTNFIGLSPRILYHIHYDQRRILYNFLMLLCIMLHRRYDQGADDKPWHIRSVEDRGSDAKRQTPNYNSTRTKFLKNFRVGCVWSWLTHGRKYDDRGEPLSRVYVSAAPQGRPGPGRRPAVEL